MRATGYRGIAAIVLCHAAFALAQESPDVQTPAEDHCQQAAVVAAGKASRDLSVCLSSCTLAARTDPTLNCSAPGCAYSIFRRFDRRVQHKCAGAACPECLGSGCRFPSSSPISEVVSRAAAIAGRGATCAGPGSTTDPDLTPGERACALARVDALARYVADELRCRFRCRLDVRAGQVTDERRCYGDGAPASLLACLNAASKRATKNCEQNCGDPPDCAGGATPASCTQLVDSALSAFPLGSVRQALCTDPTQCQDGRRTGSELCDPSAGALPDIGLVVFHPTEGCPIDEACTYDCTRCVPACGDGFVHTSEVCDPGGIYYSPDEGFVFHPAVGCPIGEGCSSDCTACAPVCGDGIVHPAELCDPAANPSGCGPGEQCRSPFSCQACDPVCGDGILHPREECDIARADSGCPATSVCDAACHCNNSAGQSPVTATLSPCDLDRHDVFLFDIAAGQRVEASVDTVASGSAADLCAIVRCPPGSTTCGAGTDPCTGDDEQVCTFAPPAFACPTMSFTALEITTCTVSVEVCSLPCADPRHVDYSLRVLADGQPRPLALVADDAPKR